MIKGKRSGIIEDYCIVRFTGQPIASLNGLLFQRRDLLDHLHTASRNLDNYAAIASSKLFQMVPCLPSDSRRKVLAARRAMNKRSALASLRRTANDEAIPAEARAVVDDVFIHYDKWIAAKDEYDTFFQQEHARAQRHFQELVQDDGFRRGLSIASQSLSTALNRLDGGGRARDKRLEQALVSYYVRAATKTSPFATFTAVGLGKISAEATDVTIRSELKEHLALSRTVISRLLNQMRDNNIVDDRCIIWINRTVTLVGEQFKYYTIPIRPDSSGTARVASADCLAQTPATPPVRAIVAELEQRVATPLGEFVNIIADRFGAPFDDVRNVIIRLIQVGLVGASVPTTELSSHFGEDLASFLMDSSDDMLRSVGSSIAKAQNEYSEVSEVSNAERLGHLQSARGLIHTAETAIGLKPYTGIVTYSDCVASSQTTEVPASWLRPFADDLSRYAFLCYAFSSTFRNQARHIDQFGLTATERRPLSSVLEEMAATNYDLVGRESPNPGSTEVQWEDYRRTLVDVVRSAIEIVRGEVRIDPSVVDEVKRLALPHMQTPRTAEIFAQVGFTPKPVVKVNIVSVGLYRYFARYGAMLTVRDEPLNCRIRNGLKELCGESIPIDIGLVWGNNTNVHAPVTDYVIGWPGVLNAPNQQPIDLSDIETGLDGGGKPALWIRSMNRPIVPIHLGYLTPNFLPQLAGFLLDFGPAVPTGMPWKDLIPDAGQPFRDRVYFGQTLLFRRGWRISRDDWPARAPDTDDATFFSEVDLWRRTMGLPTEVFVTADPQARQKIRSTSRTGHKPQFIDFQNLLQISKVASLRDEFRENIVAEEVFPQHMDTRFRMAGGERVAELIVQVRC